MSQNAVDKSVPIVVAEGGTGNSSLNANEVLVGAGTSAVTSITNGVTGDILWKNSISTFLFSSAPGGPSTNGSRLNVKYANIGGTTSYNVIHTDDTAATDSNAYIEIFSAATSADQRVSISSTDSRAFGISTNSNFMWINSFSTATATRFWYTDPNGQNYSPNQPAVTATGTSNSTNVTGDGTLYTLVGLTSELFDQNNNFASSTFTAPSTGIYYISFTIELGGLVAGNTDCSMTISTSNRDYLSNSFDYGPIRDGSDIIRLSMSTYSDMDEMDTAAFKVVVSGGAAVTSVNYNGTATVTTRISTVLVS